ncbi:hypothetical protein GEMRC1_003286 [Eukaryota sp. GEM-RC1]
MVQLTLNGTVHDLPDSVEGQPLIDVAFDCGVDIPRRCWHPATKFVGSCGVCMVQIQVDENAKPKNGLACKTAFSSGMVVDTQAPKVKTAQQKALERLEKKRVTRTSSTEDPISIQDSTICIKIDPSSCIECSRCTRACSNVQDMNILKHDKTKGTLKPIITQSGCSLEVSGCIGCGACSVVCPTSSISEFSHIDDVMAAMKDPSKVVCVQTAPTVRTQMGEPFGVPPSAETEGKMVTLLRRLGFDYVYDTQFAADLTIMEEGHELIERLSKKWSGEEVAMPQFTSCCPAWVNYVEQHKPEFIPNLSSAKIPHGHAGRSFKNLDD